MSRETKFIVKLLSAIVVVMCMAFMFDHTKVQSNIWTGLLFHGTMISVFALACVDDL